MFKYEKLFERKEGSVFASAESLGDWRECYEWYKKHKLIGRQKFADWLPYLLTQSVSYIQDKWEFYCQNSMEEMAFNVIYTKSELLA